MRKNLVPQIMTALLLIALLASCGSGSGSTDTTAAPTTESTVPVETGPVPEVPDKKWEGETFTIYDRGADPKEFLLEESTGDVQDDAVYERMAAVSEKTGVKFAVVNGGSTDAYGTGATNSIMAGDNAYQLVCSHARSSFVYAQAGLALDWNELPYVDFEKPWWDKNMLEGLGIGNKNYVLVDDLSVNSLGSTKCMLFNKDILDTFKLDYPYQLVKEGKWTFDKMAELSTKVFADLNGDTIMDIETDRFGYASTWWGSPMNILWTADQRICEIDKDGYMVLTLNTPRTIEVFEKFFKFTDGESAFIELKDDGARVEKAFKDSRLCFYETLLGQVAKMRDMEGEFGVVPCPKFDDSVDTYITGVDAGCNGLIVPITIQDDEMVSTVLELWSYENYTNVIPVYYDVVLKTKASRDNESAEMIDIIREGRMFDIGYFYSNSDFSFAINSIGYQLTKIADHNFASYYAQNEATALSKLEVINGYYFGE